MLGGALAVNLVEQDFTQSHRLGSNLDIFVGLDILQSLLQRKDLGRNNHSLVVGSRRTHIGKLLGLGDIDCNIALACALAHNLTAIDLLHGRNEEAATVLQLVDRVGVGRTCLRGDE